VLMVDSREHTVIEANAAAADLFGTTPAGLRNQPLSSLAAEPWDFGSDDGAFLAATFSGKLVPCTLRYELVKTEGVPTLLVVLERSAGAASPPVHEPTSEEPLVLPEAPPPVSLEKPPLPKGPGMLVTINPVVREVARRLLQKIGHPVEAFSSLDDATVWLITHDVRPELVALDLSDFDDANTWLAEVRARCGDVPCVGFTEGETFVLPDDGPNTLLEKPFDLDALGTALASAGVESGVRVTA